MQNNKIKYILFARNMHVVLKYFVSLQRADERYISGF